MKTGLDWAEVLIPHLTDAELVNVQDLVTAEVAKRELRERQEKSALAKLAKPVVRPPAIPKIPKPVEPEIPRMPWPSGYSPRDIKL